MYMDIGEIIRDFVNIFFFFFEKAGFYCNINKQRKIQLIVFLNNLKLF